MLPLGRTKELLYARHHKAGHRAADYAGDRADARAGAGLVDAQERRDRQFRALSTEIDRFLAAEIDITGTLVQVREVVSANRDTVNELRAAAIDLKRTIEGVLDLVTIDRAA